MSETLGTKGKIPYGLGRDGELTKAQLAELAATLARGDARHLENTTVGDAAKASRVITIGLGEHRVKLAVPPGEALPPAGAKGGQAEIVKRYVGILDEVAPLMSVRGR